MAKIITLTTVKINSIFIDYEMRRVVVSFNLTDDNNVSYETKEAIFWQTIPVLHDPITGAELPTPNLWLQLPVKYQTTIVDLYTDARSAIAARVL